MKSLTDYKNTIGLKKGVIICFMIILPTLILAQAGINTDGSTPDNSAMLDLKSTEMGFLPPRMTTAQRNAIQMPAEGLVIYNTDHKLIELFNGTIWTSNSGEFVCQTSQVADADGNVYNTVLIGNQCWMKENLRVGTRVAGSGDQTDNDVTEKYCYNDDPDFCEVYGGLYQWDEMMAYTTSESTQGICPEAWHLPSVEEYDTLLANLNGTTNQGGQLKEAGTTHWLSPNSGATNESGFTALGAGYRYEDSPYFYALGYTILLLSSTQQVADPTTAYSLEMLYDSQNTSWEALKKIYGYSVRCLKDR